jgi:hypothetical protein
MPTAMAVRTIEPKYRCTSHTARTTASACLRSWEDAVPLSLSLVPNNGDAKTGGARPIPQRQQQHAVTAETATDHVI